MRPNAPDNRAAYFMEKFVEQPVALDDLRSVAEFSDTAGPDGLIGDVRTSTAITYLRGRVRLGAKLRFQSEDLAGKDSVQRVRVAVSEGLNMTDANALIFQVDLVRRDSVWMVTRLTAN
jgi:hypothetical protein